MSTQEDELVLGTSQEEQESSAPGPSRRLTPQGAVNLAQAQYRLLSSIASSRGPERTPRPNIIQPRHLSTINPQSIRNPILNSQPQRATALTHQQGQNSLTTVSPQSDPSIYMDPQFRQMYPATYNAHLQLQQQASLASRAGSVSANQSLRAVPSTAGQSGSQSQAQVPRPVAPNPTLIRPTNFRPRLPITPEVLDGLFRAQAQGRNYPAPAATLKRQASPTGDRPAKRSISSALKAIPWPSGVVWDEEQAINFVCSLCFEQFKEPHITGCGHTFCLTCIERFLLLNTKCPNCNAIVRRENIAPNRALHQLMRKQKDTEKAITNEVRNAAADVVDNGNSLEDLDVHTFFQKKYNDLSLGEVEILMSMLAKKKEVLFNESEECRRTLVHDFLLELQQLKQAELNKILEELGHINSDLSSVSIIDLKKTEPSNNIENSGQIKNTEDEHNKNVVDDLVSQTQNELPSSSAKSSGDNKNGTGDVHDIHFSTRDTDLRNASPTVAQRKLKIHSHFDILANMYLKSCHSRSTAPTESQVELGCKTKRNEPLDSFADALVRISRYNSFKLLATLTYNNDTLTNANIVSTIEFDKDKDFFAIAGVTKKIRVFEYGSVIAAAVNMQTANGEIACSSKISCISYSRFYKNKLASSDYDGKVNIYDTSTCEPIASLNEHEKRVWSVDFSDSDPRFLVSGSDDCKVKLWSITQQNSGTTLHTNANVCCVKFVPGSSYTIACGSADHCIHYYDFRQPKGPLRVYDGHKKAVSYVQFASKSELISASTDGNLKLWDLNKRDCVRSYVGHMNDKNFVGLTTDGNYIACGSEDNSVYVYYKDIPSPILSYKFENYRSMINPARQEDVSCEFVSAVAWRTGSPVIVAANSQGIIKVLELI